MKERLALRAVGEDVFYARAGLDVRRKARAARAHDPRVPDFLLKVHCLLHPGI
jgi:hypothetical protein